MAKATTRKSVRIGDTYMELVRRLPLKTIKNDAEHKQAADMISQLMDRDLDSGSGDYLDALIVLVTTYEDGHHDAHFPAAPARLQF